MQRALSADPVVEHQDHVTSTQPAADRQAGRAIAATRTDWRRAADRTLELVRDADMAAEVTVWGIPLPLSALLVARAFELWTHENDIRRVAGLPASVPDVSTLRLMTELATSMLPFGAMLASLPGPVNLRLVLTGHGGGTWDVVIGGDAPRRLSSASSPTWSISAAWPRTGSTPPTSTCMSPATRAGRSACWRRPRRWRSTNRRPGGTRLPLPSRLPWCLPD